MCNRSPRMTPTAPRSGCRRPEDTTMRTQPIPTLATAAVLATLALPCAARAATVGTIPVGRDGVTGTFQTAGETQTWTVQLLAGRDYALGVDSQDISDFPAEVAAAGGAVLCAAQGGEQGGPRLRGGRSFRAPYAGLYTPTATAAPGHLYSPA